jgi:inorganic pyrophosphatase
MNLKYLPVGPNAPHEVNAVVEIPKGSRNKYEYNLEFEVFQLDRVLYSSMHYPEAYGFIPHTLYEDGDPVDVMIFIDQPLDVGVFLQVRPIGMLRMKDEKGNDDKIIAVAIHDPTYAQITDIRQLPKHLMVEVEYFFTRYKDLEGKAVVSFGWSGPHAARQTILKGIRAFEKAEAEAPPGAGAA